MLELTFNMKDVRDLIDHANDAKENRAAYTQEASKPALWLVGDRGVYLMSNGQPALPAKNGQQGSHVVYANECNPNEDEFDDWWAVKNATFGGDDGVETIPMDLIEGMLADIKVQGFVEESVMMVIRFEGDRMAFNMRGLQKVA